MNCLVTGGAGFIGSNLADELLKRGNDVVVIDNFDLYYPREVKEQNIKHNLAGTGYKFYEMDIRNTEKLSIIMSEESIDTVFHLAARPGVRASIVNPFIYSEVNALGTLSVLKACLDSDVKKLIYASSSSVYGSPEYLPIDENHPTNPISPYGVSKLSGEKYCLVFNQIYGIEAFILRYFTVFGPRQRPDEAIYKFTKLIFEGKPITIYGVGNQTRDFTYISDIVNGTILTVENNISGGIFNLGSGKRVSVNELVRILQEAVGKNAKTIYVERQAGDVSDTWANIEKARRILGYNPVIDVKSGVRKFVTWFLKNLLLLT